jgi:hypothetical protein
MRQHVVDKSISPMTEKVIVDMELFSDNNKYCRC